jgi:SHS family lactate transporter-like MFS transporter
MVSTNIADQSPTVAERWWEEPTREQWRTLLAAWAGWCLDLFDFSLLVLVLGDVAKTYDVSLVAMGTVLTGTLMCRVFGGILFGTWGDRVGRKLPLMVSIATYAVFSGLSGAMPTFGWFFVCRLLFGFGMGGEWAAGTPLAMESWPKRSRGTASAILQSGYPCGYFLATIAYFIVYPLWGWRVLFMLGFLPALLVFYVRKNVKESPVFEARRAALKDAGKTEKGISVLQLFRPGLVWTSLHAFLVMTGAMLSNFTMAYLWPTYLTNDLHLTVGQKTLFLILLNIGSLVGYLCAGSLSEITGRRVALSAFALTAILVIPLYSLSSNFTLVMIGAILEGFFAVGLWGIIPAYLSERFPTSVRGVGPGASFSVGAALGSFGPTVQTLLVQNAGITVGQAIAVGMAFSLTFLAVWIFVGPEPKGREFTGND